MSLHIMHFGFGGKVRKVTHSNTANATGNRTGSGTITYTAQSLGTATADRIIAVAIDGATLNAGTISAMTVNGVTATARVQQSRTPGSTIRSEIWTAAVSSGTSGDIVVTVGDTSNYRISVYAIYGAPSETPSDTDGMNAGSGGTTASLTALTIPANGVGIACAANNVVGDPTHTWSGLTERDDNNIAGGNLGRTSASDEFSSASTPTITMTSSITINSVAMTGAAWAP